jgi:hypothetical protein
MKVKNTTSEYGKRMPYLLGQLSRCCCPNVIKDLIKEEYWIRMELNERHIGKRVKEKDTIETGHMEIIRK